MEEEKDRTQATRVINSFGLWGEPPLTPVVHPTRFHSSFLPDTRAQVALVRVIKNTEDVSGKTQGRGDSKGDKMGETARDGRERGGRQRATRTGAGTVAAGTRRGETEAERSEEGRRGAREDRVGPQRMWGEGRQRWWEKMSRV